MRPREAFQLLRAQARRERRTPVDVARKVVDETQPTNA
jgi:AmiR/NasT family two-component response regulator